MSGNAKLSAGWISKGRIALRGLASLIFRKPPPSASSLTGDTFMGREVISTDTGREQRIPPGQFRTKKWPVLHAGPTPKIDPASWDFAMTGLVEQERRLTWDEFRGLPTSRVFADMHCVTAWSMLDNWWEGVLVADVMRLVQLRPTAKFAAVHAENGYTTNLAIGDLLGDDCLFAWGHNGVPLEPDHGWPLRLVVPRLYAWKSAKWVRGVEFLEHDRPGFWEENGYHNHGDPWTQERFW